MREVASLAGVSLKTVSRVINREPGVSAALVDRVLDAADRLDFRRNLAASNLRRGDGKTATLGLLLEDVSNPYSAAVHRAVEDVVRSRDLAVLAASLDEDARREQAIVQAMISRRVDGLIVAPAGRDQSYLRSEVNAGLALVFIDRRPGFIDADVVVSDNREGAERAVAHLIANGHERIAYLGDLLRISTAQDRYMGYVSALAGAGLGVDPSIVVHDLHTSELSEAAAVQLLDSEDPPSAFFTSQNLVTIGVVRALRARHLEHSVAMVGFDDIPLADLLEPGLTVIAQDASTIGRQAAELVFQRLDGERGPSVEVIVPTALIERGSGEIRATQ